jgi:hypothetical protein
MGGGGSGVSYMEDTQSASQSLTPESLPVWIPMLTVNVLGVMQERTLSLSLCHNLL